jgi:hypothetical protein
MDILEVDHLVKRYGDFTAVITGIEIEKMRTEREVRKP